jgi:hypothetical protein
LAYNNLKHIDFVDDTHFEKLIYLQIKNLNLIIKSAQLINLKESSTLDIVFLSCYNFLEQLKGYYVTEDNYKFFLGIEEFEMNRYSFYKGVINNEGPFIRNNKYDNPSWFNSLVAIFSDYLEVGNINDKCLQDLNRIKDKRNDFIHGSKKGFDQKEIQLIINLIVKVTLKLKE